MNEKQTFKKQLLLGFAFLINIPTKDDSTRNVFAFTRSRNLCIKLLSKSKNKIPRSLNIIFADKKIQCYFCLAAYSILLAKSHHQR